MNDRKYKHAWCWDTYDTEVENTASTLEEIHEELQGHPRAFRKKRGPLFHPQTYLESPHNETGDPGYWRRLDNVEAHHWLALDIDGTVEFPAKFLQLWPFAGIAYSSWSHGDPVKAEKTKTLPIRFRVLLPLACSLSPADDMLLRKWASIRCGAGVLGKEHNNQNLGFYTPRAKNPAADSGPWIRKLEGPVLDPHNLPDGLSIKSIKTLLDAEKAQRKPQRHLQLVSGSDEEELVDALHAIPADCDYNDWILVGMALSDVPGGLAKWDNWSRGGSKYRDGECERKWRSFKGSGRSTATIFELAMNHGWQQPRSFPTVHHAPPVLRSSMANALAIDVEPLLTRADDGRYEVQITGRDLHQRARSIFNAIADDEFYPLLFNRLNRIVEICGAPGEAQAVELDANGLTAHLGRRFVYFIMRKDTKGEWVSIPTDVKRDLAERLKSLGQSGVAEIPPLRAVIRSPVFDPNHTLVESSGYHESIQVFADLAGLEVKRPASIPEALDIIGPPLDGFPFKSRADMVHALCMVFTVLLRPAIRGNTPLFLMMAPTRGTGKSLLVNTLCSVVGGCESMIPPAREEEWSKTITGVLMRGSPAVLIDNINRQLDSASLASLITTRIWSGRRLGTNEFLSIRNDTVWMATANNASISSEIARRTVVVQLDAGVELPEERSGFSYHLPDHYQDHRAEILGAFVYIVESWVAAGAPLDTSIRFGSFEHWSQVMGGILHHCGMGGHLLGNRESVRERVDSDADVWPPFIAAWLDEHGSSLVSVGNLLDLALKAELLAGILGDKSRNSQLSRLGIKLKQIQDRVISGHTVTRAKHTGKNTNLYSLRKIAKHTANSNP